MAAGGGLMAPAFRAALACFTINDSKYLNKKNKNNHTENSEKNRLTQLDFTLSETQPRPLWFWNAYMAVTAVA